jgi:hypothetical protein
MMRRTIPHDSVCNVVAIMASPRALQTRRISVYKATEEDMTFSMRRSSEQMAREDLEVGDEDQ